MYESETAVRAREKNLSRRASAKGRATADDFLDGPLILAGFVDSNAHDAKATLAELSVLDQVVVLVEAVLMEEVRLEINHIALASSAPSEPHRR